MIGFVPSEPRVLSQIGGNDNHGYAADLYGADMGLKVTIDARNVLLDIRGGMSDSALMSKYGLSATGLQSLFQKLLDAGIIKQSEVDDRMPLVQKTVDLVIFRCPACGMPQFSEFDECPQCGVIVSKFKRGKAEPSSAPEKAPEQPSTIPEKAEAPVGRERPASRTVTIARTEAMFRSNGERTGIYHTKPVKELTELKWKFKTDGWVSASPAVGRLGVYCGSLDGNFYMLDAETGAEKWRFPTGSAIYSSCALTGSMVFFGSLNGKLYALNLENGDLLYDFPTAGPVYSSPLGTIRLRIFRKSGWTPSRSGFGFAYREMDVQNCRADILVSVGCVREDICRQYGRASVCDRCRGWAGSVEIQDRRSGYQGAGHCTECGLFRERRRQSLCRGHSDRPREMAFSSGGQDHFRAGSDRKHGLFWER